MNRPDHDPSVAHEPHLRQQTFQPDPSEAPAAQHVRQAADRQTEDERIEHSVWDEPGLSRELSGDPALLGHGMTYAAWLARRQRQTSRATQWLVTLALVSAAGGWGILGAIFARLFGGGPSAAGVVMLTVVGPLTEEIMKVALALWVVEKRPFLFGSSLQILLCAAAGGAMFAVTENLLYLNVYVPNPSPLLVTWRWTVCLGLHTLCSLIAGVGLLRMWRETMLTHQRPRLTTAAPLLTTAMVLHGLYNGAALLLEQLLPF